MTPKHRSKLPLNRETIRALTVKELALVGGGAVSYGGRCSITHVTGVDGTCGDASVDQCQTDPSICC